MNIDELLREAAPDQGRLHAEAARMRSDVLARATAHRRRHARRAVRVGIAGAVVAAAGLGGVAYATDSGPAWLTNLTDGFGEYAGVPVEERPDMTQVVDLQLPDGSRFAAWRGISDGMWCTAYRDRWDGRSYDRGMSACSDGGPASYGRISIVWAGGVDASTYYPVLFGDPYDGAVAVHVTGRFAGTGERVDLTLPVDPATDAFAGILPGVGDRHSPWTMEVSDSDLTVEFLDAAGQVMRTVDGPAA
jgi:hypothetical protein